MADLDHDANLAEHLDEHVLAALADELIDAFEADWLSNEEERETLTRGLELLGLKPGERIDMPFPGASGVRHPLLLEAAVRFQANASAELLPAAGPARMQVAGDATPDEEAVAKRKQDWLNYFLCHVDKGYLPDAQQGLLLTGLYGSTFKRVWRDPRRGRPCSRTLTIFDLCVSATAASLYDAERMTQIERSVSRAEMKRLQLAGYYRDVPLSDPSEGDDLDPKPGDRAKSERAEDEPHEMLHVYCTLDLRGLEHCDEAGETTGLPLPYVVSIERDSRTVMRLVRNYADDDELFLPRDSFVHYKYHPGLGLTGWGLIHLVGQSADAATTMLRQGINAFTLASFPGGFKSKGLKSEKSMDAIGPCEFREIDTGGQPIQAAVMPLPYKDVPPSFAQLMEEVTTSGQRMGGTADMAVGDGREDAAVGTTVALIEKATKVESSVVKSLHRAMAEELRMLADLFGRDPAARYPYLVKGQRGVALASDFQTNDDIVPVSDPNAPTQTQRLALAQAKLALAEKAGPLMDQKAAIEGILRAMGCADEEIATLIPDQPPPLSADPVTEFQAVMMGKPVATRPDQDHAAHIAVHQSQLAAPGIEKTPPAALLAAHIAEHVGQLYRQRVGAMLGQPLPPAGPLPPQVEAQVTAAVAKVAQQVAASLPGGPGQTKPDIGPVEAHLKMLDMQTKQAESDRKAKQQAVTDQIEIARMNVQSQDEEATREQKQRDNATTISAALIGAMAQQDQGCQDIQKVAAEGTAQLMAEAQAQSGQAMQNRHNAGMGLLDLITQNAQQHHEAGQALAEHAEAARQRAHEKSQAARNPAKS